MSKGSKEIDRMFNKLNSLIDKAKDLKERVKRKWEEEFRTTFVSYELPKFLDEIEFFQNKYNFSRNLKIDTERVLSDISEKYSIKSRTINLTEEPKSWERALYLIIEAKELESDTKKYARIEPYGKFYSDPQEDFSSLLKGLMSMYHHCLKKHTPSELDVGELNILNILKLRFLKDWQSILFLIVIGIIVIISFAFLNSWISTLFNN